MRQRSAGFGFRSIVSSLVGVVIVTGPVAPRASAAIQAVTVSSDMKFASPRWMFGEGEAPKGSDPVALLAAVKRAQLDGNFEECVDHAKAARAKAKSLQAWLSVVEIDCAAKAAQASRKPERLAKALEATEKSPTWFLTGPQAPLLRQTVFKGYLALIEQDTKSNRARHEIDRARSRAFGVRR